MYPLIMPVNISNIRYFCSNQLHKRLLFSSLLPTAKYSNLASFKDSNGVRKITLSNPKSRNALSLDMMNKLIDFLSTDLDSISLRCIVISAEGPVFSSGHNLKELILENKDFKDKEVFTVCSVLMKRIMEIPVPVIAAVDGAAVAAGCQLVAQCDIAVCTEKSVFSTPGSHFGIFCSTPGIPLVRTVPRKLAAHMLMTGLPITAQEALNAGLVSKVVPDGQLDENVSKVCDAIKSQSKSVVALGKKFFYEQIELDIASAYRLGEEIMYHNVQLADGQEGIKSFAEKRKPTWSHDSVKLQRA